MSVYWQRELQCRLVSDTEDSSTFHTYFRLSIKLVAACIETTRRFHHSFCFGTHHKGESLEVAQQWHMLNNCNRVPTQPLRTAPPKIMEQCVDWKKLIQHVTLIILTIRSTNLKVHVMMWYNSKYIEQWECMKVNLNRRITKCWIPMQNSNSSLVVLWSLLVADIPV